MQLFYNVYSNITDRQYFKIEKELLRWKYVVATMLNPSGWRAVPTDTDKGGLGFSFTKKTGIIRGSIGMTFDDQPSRITFSYGVLKCFDENHIRYCMEADLFKDKEAQFFGKDFGKFTDEALKEYNCWDKEYIMKFGDKIELL